MIPLSPMERKVLRLYEAGRSYKAIAVLFTISPHTVRTHARRIIAKSLAESLRHAAWLRR